jgi:hypothetical protein
VSVHKKAIVKAGMVNIVREGRDDSSEMLYGCEGEKLLKAALF